MNKKDKYYGMENTMEMNPGMGMPMQPMMPMYPWMMPMNCSMMTEDLMPNMPMQCMNPMQSMMCMNPMMRGMNMQPTMMDENYINHMINMNKYLSHLYKAEAYKLQAMQYTKDMEQMEDME